MSGHNKLITLDLPPDEAHAPAQTVKRLDRSEPDAMIAGIDKLQHALAEAGFAQR
jgi:hypothetical protein